jgi:glycosyltransferase involved in cell wall biosynthesis
MRPRLRILVVSYLPPAGGGIATWARILKEGSTKGPYCLLFEELASTSEDGRRHLPFKLLDAAGLICRLVRRLVRDRPEVAHVNCCLSPLGVWRDLLVGSLMSVWHVPLLAHYHGSLPAALDRLPMPSRIALRGLMTIADMNVGVSGESESLLRRVCGTERTTYLPNFIEDGYLSLPPGEVRKDAPKRGRVRAVYVGRLSTDKGTHDLLQAARRLPRVDFSLIGEISRAFRQAVEGGPPNVIATGALPRADVMALLRDADMFVFPSHREGFPNAVLEGMAAGLPVISTRVGAIPEMVQEGIGGYLVAPSDPNALAIAIRRLAEDRALSRRMGAHNRATCLRKFRFDTVFATLTAMYERIAEFRPNPRSEPSVLPPLSTSATVRMQRGRGADP